MYLLDSKKIDGEVSTPPYVYPGFLGSVGIAKTAKIFYIFKLSLPFSLNKVSTRGFSDLFMA